MKLLLRQRWLWPGAILCLIALIAVASSLYRHSAQPDNPAPLSDSPLAPSPLAPSPSVDLLAPTDTSPTPPPPSPPNVATDPKHGLTQEGRFVPPPPPDQNAVAFHQKAVVGLNARMRQDTKRLYGSAFQQLHLPEELQNKVIDILMQPQQQLEQQAFEAAQSGTLPVPPSPETLRAQQAAQNQQLRSALGNDGFAALSQYRATIPDRMIVEAMNRQGANLNESQSQRLLQVLTGARQEIVGQPGTAQASTFLPPEQSMAQIQQQQALLQQTVNNRVQNVLTPEQASTLQSVMAGFSVGPKPR